MDLSYSELFSQREKLIGDLPLIEKSMSESLLNELTIFCQKNMLKFIDIGGGLIISLPSFTIKTEVFFDKVVFLIRPNDVRNIEKKIMIDQIEVEVMVEGQNKRMKPTNNYQLTPKKIVWYPTKTTIDNLFKTTLSFTLS